jgi:hypothetical protein
MRTTIRGILAPMAGLLLFPATLLAQGQPTRPRITGRVVNSETNARSSVPR